MELKKPKEPTLSAKEAKARLRRERLVESAMICVARHGIRGATTARIAMQAGISEGLIYRHFPGKEAIVGAIAETLTQRRMERIVAARDSAHLADLISRDMTDESPEMTRERAIFAEMQSEAFRNPAISAILQKSDQALKDKALRFLLGEFPHLSPGQAAGLVEYMATLMDGRWLRANRVDRKTTEDFLSVQAKALSLLLSRPENAARKVAKGKTP
jgi:AcrR family transcriptional regulator